MTENRKPSPPEYEEIIQLHDQTAAPQTLKLRVILNETETLSEEQSEEQFLLNENKAPETQLVQSTQVAFEQDIELQQEDQDLQISVNVNAFLLEKNEALEIEVQLLTRLLRDKEEEYKLHYQALEEQVRNFQGLLADLQGMKRKCLFLTEQQKNDESRKLEETDRKFLRGMQSPLGLQEESKKLPDNSGNSPARVKAPTEKNALTGPSAPDDQIHEQQNQEPSAEETHGESQLVSEPAAEPLWQPPVFRDVIRGIANTFLKMYRTGTLKYWVDYWYF
ncbi:uncharacterized protein LOC103470732 [Poecilia reticulata]|uniref:uncharacterized protein LOC103470732 n=1 Tax=Poecilia reticulata TaxID=8081 RepID=UPI0004A293DA|nr:PREDICTED: uncharacterized protein LOC103470732 [Poecilia reticulata]